MGKFSKMLSNFIGGEISPKSYGGTSEQGASRFLKTCKNFIPHIQGGASRRPGFRIAKAAPFGAQDSRLFPYLAPAGERIWIFFQNGSVYTLDADHGNRTTISNSSGSTPVSSATAFMGYTGSNIVALPHDLQGFQVGDVMWFVHPDVPPFQLRPSLNSDGSFNTMTMKMFYEGSPIARGLNNSHTDAADQWPFIDLLATGITFTLSNKSDDTQTTCTASADFFDEGMERTPIVFVEGSNWGWSIIETVSNATTATVHNISTSSLSTGSGVDAWESAWSDYRGWPRSITQFEQRLYFGGSAHFPDTVWATEIDDFNQMSVTDHFTGTDLTASDPFNFKLQSSGTSAIQWLSSGTALQAGTETTEFQIKHVDETKTLGTGNVFPAVMTTHGSVHHQPVRRDNSIVWIHKSGTKLYEGVLSRDEDLIKTVDLNIVADHVVDRSLEEDNSRPVPLWRRVVYQEHPYKIIWLLDNNGKLSAITRDSQNNTMAWHYIRVGGAGSESFTGSDNDFNVADISIIRSEDETRDEVWIHIDNPTSSDSTALLCQMVDEWKLSNLTTNTSKYEPNKAPVFLDAAEWRKASLPTYLKLGANLFKHVNLSPDSGIDGETAPSLSGTVNGTEQYDGGAFDLDGSTYIEYDTSSATHSSSDGHYIRFHFKPGYSGTPGADSYFFSISSASNDQIALYHDSAGDIKLKIDGSTHTFDSWSPSSATTYLFDLFVGDSTKASLWIDGTKNGSTATITAPGVNFDSVKIGSDYNGANYQTGKIRGFQWFDAGETSTYYPFVSVGNYYWQSGVTDLESDFDYYQIRDNEYSPDPGTWPVWAKDYVIAGFNAYAGKTVSVMADGAKLGTKSIDSDGLLDLGSGNDVSEVVVGVPYESKLVTMDLSEGVPPGVSSVGYQQGLAPLYVKRHKSLGGNVGLEGGTSEEIEDSSTSDPPDLSSDLQEVHIPSNYQKEIAIEVSSTDPYPLLLTGVVTKGVTYE